MSTRLYLIRHGLTESNRQSRYMGRTEEPLSSEGRWQARQLARQLRHVRLDAFYSSPLRRTKETAAIVNQPHGHEVSIEPGLNELDLGRWEGQTGPEIAARDPEAWQTWCNDPASMLLDGIEPFGVIQQRVRKTLARLARKHPDGGIAAVTHDGIIRIAVLEALGISLGHYRAMPIDNTGVTVLELAQDRNYLRQLNAIGHLGDGEAATQGPADR